MAANPASSPLPTNTSGNSRCQWNGWRCLYTVTHPPLARILAKAFSFGSPTCLSLLLINCFFIGFCQRLNTLELEYPEGLVDVWNHLM